MTRTMFVAPLLVVAVACSGGGHRASKTGLATTTSTLPIARVDVTDIKVGAVPESPVMNYAAERAHWSAVVALLPAQLPSPIPHATCTTGPLLILRLRNGSDITYECTLPPTILATRNYILSLKG